MPPSSTIDPTRWAGLTGLMFTARRLVEGLYAGGHASPHHGPGVEFHDYRPYVPGDDLAAVDWKLYGRTNRFYLRRYQRYTDLHAWLVVDTSPSMAFAGLDRRGRARPGDADRPSKLQYARELAAAIAFLLVRQTDRVGLATFGAGLRDVLPPAARWAHLQQCCATLEGATPDHRRGNVGTALAQLHGLIRRRGLVVLIGDLLDDPAGLFDGLNRLRHARCEAMVLQVLTPQELDLEAIGPQRLKLVDPEVGRQVATHVPSVARRYREVMDEHLATIRRGCLARGVDYALLRTDTSPIEGLRALLGRRAAQGRSV